MDEARDLIEAHAQGRVALIAESYAAFTGRSLRSEGFASQGLWESPLVILAHGSEEDPVFFYGNRRALDLFEVSAEDFIRMPSRLSAEPLARLERDRLLDRVARDGFIDDYAGVRVSATGRRFRIEQAVVWNLTDPAGVCHGQAAAFDRWTPL